MKPGEPLWLDEDFDALIEYLREEKLVCPGCGHPRDETMDPAAEGHFRARVLKCHACAARDRTADEYRSQAHQPAGILFSVERLDD